MKSEVVILGAGILGCSTAYFLAQAGVGVTVLDPVGVAAGASGRNNGLIEHPYDAATEALYYQNVEVLREVLGTPFTTPPPEMLLLTRSEPDAMHLRDSYRRFERLDVRLLTPPAARVAEPILADGIWACAVRTGYPVRPVEVTTEFADRARAAGARFVLGDPVAPLRDGDQLVGAECAGQRYLADTVVVCAGARTTRLLDGLTRPDLVAPLWGVIVSVELEQRPRHSMVQAALALAHGSGKVTMEAPFTLLDCPSWLAVGSTMLTGEEPDRELWRRRLLEQGAEFVPSIARARVKDVKVCARPEAFDNHPLLGRVPGQQHAWLASGHGGRGMSLGPASGRLLAQAISAGDESAIPAPLSTRRLA